MPSLTYQSDPIQNMHGTITVPGDKSISHRAVMLASIAKGTSTINNFLDGHDCQATIRAMRAMGVKIEGPIEKRVVVRGVGKYGLKAPHTTIDCGNSGTTMRLLSGLLAAQPFPSVLDGDDSLRNRPMRRIIVPLLQMGAAVTASEGKPPVYIQSSRGLKGITYDMPIASAQVKSCLLLAGMYADGETTIIEPSHTRDHTERLLTALGYPIHKSGQGITIMSEGECIAADIIVPGDISSAAFFIVAACLLPGSDLIIQNVGINPTRTGILDILRLMGADIALFNKRLCGEEPVADLRIKHAPLEGIDIPASLIPSAIDEFPVIFIAAACAKGQTKLQGAHELRVKESDRIGVMASGLRKVGIEAQDFEDGIIIQGGTIQGGMIDSEGDHRIAMSFAVAGAVSKQSIKILKCEHIATSFPHFLETAAMAGLRIQSQMVHSL